MFGKGGESPGVEVLMGANISAGLASDSQEDGCFQIDLWQVAKSLVQGPQVHWRCPQLQPWPLVCQADVLPSSWTPQSPSPVGLPRSVMG